MPYYINPPPQNPLVRLFAAIIAVLALVGTFMIGMAAFLVIAGIGVIAGTALWLRVAWIKRKLRKSGVRPDVHTDIPKATGQVIDAEYTVISDPQDQSEK